MVKYLIAIPCMNTMVTPFVASLTRMHRVGASKVTFLSNSMVYDSRNMLAAEAIDTGADRVLWLDSDMQFSVDLMERLAADMDTGLDYVSGLYFRRVTPLAPILGKSMTEMCENGKTSIKTEPYFDYPKDSLFEIACSGFGVAMTSTKLLKSVFDAFGMPFGPMPGIMGEDYAFCWRARKLGYTLWCDSRIKADHIGLFSFGERHYIAQI